VNRSTSRHSKPLTVLWQRVEPFSEGSIQLSHNALFPFVTAKTKQNFGLIDGILQSYGLQRSKSTVDESSHDSSQSIEVDVVKLDHTDEIC